MGTQSTANLMPAGSGVISSLKKGVYDLEIINIEPTDSDSFTTLRLNFPDSFAKTFQVTDNTDLVAQVARQLRGRYGVEAFEFKGLPKALKVGAILELEIL